MPFMRSSFGDTTGTVSMVPATAISSGAVNVLLVMTADARRQLRCQGLKPGANLGSFTG